jgi:hypothetical protein
VIDLAVAVDPDPRRARTSRRRRGGPRVYRATTPMAPGRVTAARDDRIGLAEQIAADLLPEAGDSRAADGGEAR